MIYRSKHHHENRLSYWLTEPPRDKTNKMNVRPAKTQISLGIRPVWSESSLSAWRKLGPLATHWAHSEDSDQTGRVPRLIWVFAERTVILLVLSRGGSYLIDLYITNTVCFQCSIIIKMSPTFIRNILMTKPDFVLFRYRAWLCNLSKNNAHANSALFKKPVWKVKNV